jgi:hypothetical protein
MFRMWYFQIKECCVIFFIDSIQHIKIYRKNSLLCQFMSQVILNYFSFMEFSLTYSKHVLRNIQVVRLTIVNSLVKKRFFPKCYSRYWNRNLLLFQLLLILVGYVMTMVECIWTYLGYLFFQDFKYFSVTNIFTKHEHFNLKNNKM